MLFRSKKTKNRSINFGSFLQHRGCVFRFPERERVRRAGEALWTAVVCVWGFTAFPGIFKPLKKTKNRSINFGSFLQHRGCVFRLPERERVRRAGEALWTAVVCVWGFTAFPGIFKQLKKTKNRSINFGSFLPHRGCVSTLNNHRNASADRKRVL